ncbi:MAG TPA: ComEC/Rec2 family competence protein [Chitinophagaceae bacterium]|nr:ComEC/Rec2 family competence protein [Chitinophagaceae bacterium]
MPLSPTPVWKDAPFLRLLVPFAAGILVQWYLPQPVTWPWALITATSAALLAFRLASAQVRFRLIRFTGVLINLLIFACGTLITWYNHPANNKNWLARHYTPTHQVQAVLQEPLSQKRNSYKAIATAQYLYNGTRIIRVTGNIVIYFSKQTDPERISYGSIITINKPLQPVKTSGNPGAFDYKRYCIFNQTSFQVYLQPGEFSISPSKETRGWKNFIFYCRQKVINILHANVKGRQEAALAEALLIGYKDELDKDLVQSYSNTGVVHIIAVSGLHLGIVYWLLSLLAGPLKKRSIKWLYYFAILAGLWIFSLVAGAGPSVLRSAFMFSLVVIGEAFSKRNTVYNSLAASAFLLLCWNPFWLWDAGFQLSYAAVLSIVLFFKPIYNLLYVRNKLLDAVWKLNAVTLAAQVLTIPISIYHFHQFPNYFLLANLVAVPLSSILLIGEIVLCALSFIPVLATWMGDVLNFLLRCLNDFILSVDALPGASWTHLQLNAVQVVMLYACIAGIAYWLLHKNKAAFIIGLCTFLGFMAVRTHSFILADAQRKLIVYNISKYSAIDFIQGRNYFFAGDAVVQSDKSLRNFHTEPSRTLHRASPATALQGLLGKDSLFEFHGKRVLLVSGRTPVSIVPGTRIDIMVLSKNAGVQLGPLLQALQIRQVVADGSNAPRYATIWRQQCQTARIPFHYVSENGAFISDIP